MHSFINIYWAPITTIVKKVVFLWAVTATIISSDHLYKTKQPKSAVHVTGCAPESQINRKYGHKMRVLYSKLCSLMPHVPPRWPNRSRDWTELNWTAHKWEQIKSWSTGKVGKKYFLSAVSSPFNSQSLHVGAKTKLSDSNIPDPPPLPLLKLHCMVRGGGG